MYAKFLARSLWESIYSHLINSVVGTSRKAAAVRRWTLIFAGGFLWAVFAYVQHPYMPNSEPVRSLLEYPIRALFAPDVIKHVLIGAFIFWFAFRVAAIYLDDIFELKNVTIAQKFVRQSAFASQYDVIEIKDGDVALKDQKSPIFLIGGPGKVRVFLENAALFEKSSGTPHVVEPTTPRVTKAGTRVSEPAESLTARLTRMIKSMRRIERGDSREKKDGAKVLESFERLRQVIDLRDHVEEIAVSGRTRDGILIHARNLRVIFSVRRDGEEPTLEKPYPFNEKAIEDLVYSLTRESWTDTMLAQIKRELGKFIARHSLSEFLAAIGTPELEQAAHIEVDLQAQADRLAGLDQDIEVNIPDPPPFVPRPAISDLFYDYNNFVARVREKGVELRWIGVGTWSLPSEIIPEKHLQAWRITYENLAWGSEAVINQLFETERAEQLLNIIQDTPVDRFNSFAPDESAMRKTNMVKLVNGYRGKLHAALEIYERRDESDSVEARKTREVWKFLAHVVARYAGDVIDGT